MEPDNIMCYKRKISISIISLLLGCGCLGVAFYVFVSGYYLPYKPCRPVTYPDGKRTTVEFYFTSTDSLTSVLQFYDQQLDVQPFPGDIGQWRREKLADSRYLYSCYGVDINNTTTETGCIYIDSDGTNTYIRTELLRAEGANNPCSK
jgi:hypothetical protein